MPVQFKELAPGVFVALTPQGGSNGGFVLGDEGVLVVDTLMWPALAREMLGYIKERSNKEIRFLVNTHHNGDHVLSNYLFSPPAQIISHVNTRSHLAKIAEDTVKRMAQSRPELQKELEGVKIPLPAITFTQQLTLHWGQRTIELRCLGPAHTHGDAVVYLPQDKVLFAGDLLLNQIVPVINAEGSSLGWIDSMNLLEELAIDHVVPGHGPLATKKELAQVRDYLLLLRDEVRKAMEQGWSKEEAAQRISMDKYASWQRQLMGRDLFVGLVDRVYDEMSKQS